MSAMKYRELVCQRYRRGWVNLPEGELPRATIRAARRGEPWLQVPVVSLGDAWLEDWVVTVSGATLLSDRLRRLIDGYAAPGEIAWREVGVDDGQDRHIYWWFNYAGAPPPLHPTASTFAPDGTPIMWVLDNDRLPADDHILGFPGSNQMLVVSETVWHAITELEATGILPAKARNAPST